MHETFNKTNTVTSETYAALLCLAAVLFFAHLLTLNKIK